jgi:DNA repair protein RadC
LGLLIKATYIPREVYAELIGERASSLIVAHNHPVGELKPSIEDKIITDNLKDADKILDINLLDHIIFNAKGYYSFAENNVI